MMTLMATGIDISLIVLPIASVALVAIAVFKILEIKKIQQALNMAIVLVPLYKRRIALIVASFVVLILMVFSVILAVLYGCIVEGVSLLTGEFAILCMLMAMMSCKFAVLDNGVLLPYRFVPWSEFCDYVIEDESIVFTGRDGRYTISSTSVKLTFNPTDKAKLEKILAKGKADKKN